MRWIIAAVLVAPLLAGCSASVEFGTCTDESQRDAFEAAQRFLGGLHHHDYLAQWDGTKGGQTAHELRTFFADAGIAAVESPGFSFFVNWPYYTIGDETSAEHRRDHDPNLIPSTAAEHGTADIDRAFRFPFSFDETEHHCGEIADVDVFQFTATDGQIERELLIRDDDPERPFRLKLVDPAAGDEYVIVMSYDVPPVSLAEGLPKTTFNLHIDRLHLDESNGLSWRGRFNAESNWIPFDEVKVVLVDGDRNGLLEASLQAGPIDFGDGNHFTYADTDGNGMISAGDEYAFDVGRNRDILFYDLWADGFANENYHS